MFWNSVDSFGGSSDIRIDLTGVYGRPATPITSRTRLRSPSPEGTPPQEVEGKYMNKTKGNKENPPPQGKRRRERAPAH